MSEKVVLTRKVSDAIKYASSILSTEEIIKYHVSDPSCWLSKAEHLNGLPLMTLMSALVNGYEVEISPEDRIRKVYESSVITSGELGCQLDDYTTKVLTRYILSTLGITIEGINGAND